MGLRAIADFFEENGPAKRCWNSPWVGAPLWLTAAYFAYRWHHSAPPTGYAIGALATVAGIMSIREVKVLGKILWMILLVFFLINEFGAIDKDRADYAAQQKAFFDAQQKGFSDTAGELQIAIHALNQTLNQTHPT
jgi:hypothetical protein